MPSKTYQLSNDAYACLADNRLVFSDIRRDKYRCLNASNTAAVLRLFPDFREREVDPTIETAADQERTELVLDALAHKGLLTDGEVGGKTAAPISVPEVTTSLLSSRPTPHPRVHFGHLAWFLQASLKASGKLRFQPLKRTIGGVESRKRRHYNSALQNYEALCEMVAVFHQLRPYYVRGYLCRFDSLALVEFLARYKLFPLWVFGVKSGPFGAHCWVQEKNCVLNDSVELVNQFTPIMAF